MANRAAFARASRAGHKAGKPGSAAYKAAFRKAFKRGSGTRSTRRAARAASPRRRRRTMAKGKSKGGFRRKAKTAITPKRIAKVLIVGDALINRSGPAINEAAFIIKNSGQIAREGMPSVIQHAKQLGVAAAPPVIEAWAGPKVVDGVVKFASRAEPLIGKVANKKLASI